MQRSSAAILLFARRPDSEAQVKQWTRGPRDRNRRIATLLHRRAQHVARATGLDVVEVDDRRQVGDSFGQRYAAAFAEVFALGYREVVSIGSDCPNLSVADLELGLARTRLQGAAAGPSVDGGLYLVGLRADRFDAAAFAALPWQTTELGDRFRGTHLTPDQTPTERSVPELPVRYDADDQAGLRRCVERAGFASRRQLWLRELANLIEGQARSCDRTPVTIHRPIRRGASLALRGPPALATR